MIEINLKKFREVKVKATADRKGHTRKIKSKESQKENEIWKAWQQHYKQDLYRPSAEPHEDMFSSVIMISQSPQKAILKLTELQKKYPSSVGADLVKEFKRLYLKTRDDVIPGRKSPMSGWIQTERQMIKMLEMIEIDIHKLERGTKKEWKTVTRGGKTFKQRFATGMKDDIKESKLKELYNKFNNIKDKLKLYNTKIDNIDTADIEPDIKEKKIKRLNVTLDKLKSDLSNIKSEIANIEKGDKVKTKVLKSKEEQLEDWNTNHTKLQDKLSSLQPKLKSITESADKADVRAARLKEWHKEFDKTKKDLKESKAKLRKINR